MKHCPLQIQTCNLLIYNNSFYPCKKLVQNIPHISREHFNSLYEIKMQFHLLSSMMRIKASHKREFCIAFQAIVKIKIHVLEQSAKFCLATGYVCCAMKSYFSSCTNLYYFHNQHNCYYTKCQTST
jgi:hypothetical protein